MKKLCLGSIFLLLLSGMAYSQESTPNKGKDGWNFGALPAVSYNTDYGFQYGIIFNLFDYGDGSRYPEYKHNFFFEVSRYTKGSGTYRIAYDSEHLIPGMRITSDLSYLPDQAFDFYGFNGHEAVYNADWADDTSLSYKSRMFYKLDDQAFRFKTDVQVPIIGKKLLGLAGINMQYFGISSVDINKMNKGKKNNLLPDVPTLYDQYVNWGIISEDEKDGGFVPLIKAGLVFDTRDNKPNPMKGMWTEAFIYGAPEFLGAESSFLKVHFTHRQYFTIVPRDLSFVYRISYQGTIAGHAPFYYQNQIETSLMKDIIGLGGRKSLRGVMRNRVVGDGYVFGTAELRWKVAHFNLINQQFYVSLDSFVDFGQTVQKIKIEDKAKEITGITQTDYFNFAEGEKMHGGYGLGIHIAMNQNFVVAVDYGRAMNKQDGSSGIYVGLDYLF